MHFLENSMFVLNAYFCRELRFVAILRSKLRFLLRNPGVDSDFTQNCWGKNWRLKALVSRSAFPDQGLRVFWKKFIKSGAKIVSSKLETTKLGTLNVMANWLSLKKIHLRRRIWVIFELLISPDHVFYKRLSHFIFEINQFDKQNFTGTPEPGDSKKTTRR